MSSNTKYVEVRMKCPYCHKAPYPIRNEDGTLNWKNILRIDMMSLFLIIGIVLIILGMNKINEQCYNLLENPCDFVESFQCKTFAVPSGGIDKKNAVQFNFTTPS